MSKFFKLYAPLYRNIPQTAELFSDSLSDSNVPQFADNFIEDLYVSDIQRVVAQSKNRPQTADDFRQYRRIVFTSGYSIQIHL